MSNNFIGLEGRGILLFQIVCFSLIMPYIDNYVAVYLIIALYLISFLHIYKSIVYRFVPMFLLVYLGVGLLNISDYRGDISIETIKLYWYCIASFFLSVVVICSERKEINSSTYYSPIALFYFIVAGHLAIVYILTLYIYATKGLVVVYQDLRFTIPTSIAYAIRSSLFIPIILMLFKDWKFDRMFIILTFACILPSFLIGSRSTGLVAIIAMMLLYVSNHNYSKIYKINLIMISIWGAAISFAMIGGGFYLRRAFSPDLMTGPDLIDWYFGGNHSLYIYLLVPFHQGFNEASALASRIIDYGIFNHFSTTALFVADFDNLLGRSNVAAAQFFGDAIGRIGDGGLTPGLIGGLFMDFSYNTIWIFLLFGAICALLLNLSFRNNFVLCLTCIYIVQFMHLFHRGFLKPEYITIFLIVWFYMLFTRKSS